MISRKLAGPIGAGLTALALTACSQETDMTADTTAAAPQTSALIERARGLEAPRAEQRPVEIEQLGFTRVDEYQWIKDDNWQQGMRERTFWTAISASFWMPSTPIWTR